MCGPLSSGLGASSRSNPRTCKCWISPPPTFHFIAAPGRTTVHTTQPPLPPQSKHRNLEELPVQHQSFHTNS